MNLNNALLIDVIWSQMHSLKQMHLLKFTNQIDLVKKCMCHSTALLLKLFSVNTGFDLFG